MKDKLLFGTIGLLVGVVVMQWAMPSGRATVVVPNSGIVAVEDEGGWLLMLDQNGQAWVSQDDGTNKRCWVRYPEYDPPMPVEQIKFWHRDHVVTIDNHAWVAIQQGATYAWHDCGAWPGAPVSSNQSTLGKVKAQYRPKGDNP